MTILEIYNMLNDIVPSFYSHAPINTPVPFATFLTDHENNFSADNKVYKEVTGITITLYMGENDLYLEDSLNTALNDADLYWVSSTDYDDNQKVYTTIYETEVI